MHQSHESLFAALWQQYLQITPSAERIHQLLTGEGSGEQGAPVINDHVAFRTFDLAPVGLEVLAAHFVALGYQPGADYLFKQKKLRARHFEHPDSDKPKVFISELLTGQCSAELQQIAQRLVAQVSAEQTVADNFLYSGALWQCSQADYQQLLSESEYAAWLAAFGYRANHFTVSVNHLAGFTRLAEVNQALKQAGFVLNSAGGEIKGAPKDLLEQSSTMADKTRVQFTDGELVIPGCFYEFALRYPQSDGQLFQGFVEASANKIFESTDNA